MACLFFSGVAGLVYEVVWTRYLALFLGHTSYAVVAVLVAFMGGLALGNYAIGRWADRVRRPLAAYAWVEIGIGVYALVFPPYLDLCQRVFVGLARGWEAGGTGLLGLRLLFSVGTILLPTVLMGGTLPLLIRLLSRSMEGLSSTVAGLYVVNSAGGVLGIGLTAFWSLEALGLRATLMGAAALNLGVGAVALLVSGWLREERGAAGDVASEPAGRAAAMESEMGGNARSALRLAVAAAGVSGFVAMLYQVGWTRLLALALGSSTHAFALMLMTFILGLTLGAWLVAVRPPRGGALAAFGWVELALAVTVGVTLFTYEFLPYWFGRLAELLVRRAETYPLYQFIQGLICVAVMFLPTFWLGMTLPLACRAATPALGRAGSSAGRVFASNTMGAVLGAALTGLWLMPWLGLARTFAVGVGANALIGVVVLCRTGVRHRAGLVASVGVGLAALWGASVWFLDPVWRGSLTLGVWRQTELASSWREFHHTVRTAPVLYHRDGAGASVSVLRNLLVTNGLYLKVNGKTDASMPNDASTQLLLGHVPMFLRPEATNVLVIGLGSGMTAGAVAAHPTPQRIDVVEILPEVLEAAEWFAPHNRRVLEDPRVRVTVDDAKSFLLMNDRRYGVIISEPSNPWMAGVAGVFTAEFYAECRAHLEPGGLMVQWVQLYEFSDEGMDLVLATFGRIFPYVSVWHTDAADVLLVGSMQPLAGDFAAMRARLSDQAVRADLDRVQLANLPLLLSHEMISSVHGAHVPRTDSPVHSDYYPVLEYQAQRDFFARRMVGRFRQLDENFSRRPSTLLGQYLQTASLQREDFEAFAGNYLAGPKPFMDLIASILLRWRQEASEDWRPLEVATQFKLLSAPGELEVLRLGPIRDRLRQRAPADPSLLRQYGLALMSQYIGQRSAFYGPPTNEVVRTLAELIESDPENQRLYQAYLGEMAWDGGDDEGCLRMGRLALLADLPRGSAKFALDRSVPLRMIGRMADVLRRRGQLREAAELCEQAARGGYLEGANQPGAVVFGVLQRRIAAELSQASDGGSP